MGCSVCKGVFHPATGSEVSPTFRRCGVCEKQFVKWLRGNTRRNTDKLDFYTYAATSIKPEDK